MEPSTEPQQAQLQEREQVPLQGQQVQVRVLWPPVLEMQVQELAW